MEKLCTKAIQKILSIANISEDEEQIEVYVYGLLSYIYTFIPLTILLAISIIFNKSCEMIIWILYFVTLRKYAGGYHAPHPLVCFLYTITLGISSLVVTQFNFAINIIVYIAIIVLSLLYFVIFSPITPKIFLSNDRITCKIKLCATLLISLCISLIWSHYQIIFLHAVICTLFLCIAEQIHKCYHTPTEDNL